MSHKYVCITTYQADTKSNTDPTRDSLWDPAQSTDSFRSALKTHLFAAKMDD